MKKLVLPTLVALLFSCSESSTEKRTSTLNIEPALIENLNIQINSFTEVDSTGILFFPLQMGQNRDENGRYSYKKMPENTYWNIVFFNSNTNEYHLLTDKKIMITNYDYKHSEGISISEKTKHIFYNARNVDYNKDKLLNEDDPISLFVSDKFGKKFRQISPENTSVKDWKYIKTSNKVIMNTIKDSNKNNQFDDNDEVLTYEVILDQAEKPREVFKPELKETLKKLYDRDWKKIKN